MGIGDRLEKKPVGRITHYFDKIGVAVIQLSGDLKKGDKLAIEGKSEPFEQVVTSMQIEREEIPSAAAGQAIGMKMDKPVKEGDVVYLVTA
jgi:translation initiation factor IF-2